MTWQRSETVWVKEGCHHILANSSRVIQGCVNRDEQQKRAEDDSTGYLLHNYIKSCLIKATWTWYIRHTVRGNIKPERLFGTKRKVSVAPSIEISAETRRSSGGKRSSIQSLKKNHLQKRTSKLTTHCLLIPGQFRKLALNVKTKLFFICSASLGFKFSQFLSVICSYIAVITTCIITLKSWYGKQLPVYTSSDVSHGNCRNSFRVFNFHFAFALFFLREINVPSTAE